MRIQQRVEASDSFFETSDVLWQPGADATEIVAAGESVNYPPPQDGDRYVTVDEHVENTIGVVAAAWPVVDRFGLSFPGRIEPAWYTSAELQSAVDRLRHQANQVQRPLRIGDTFWVRGFSESSPQDWHDLRDVTAQARQIVKAAVAVATLGPVHPPTDDPVLAASDEPSDQAAAVIQQPPGGAATARPTI